MALKDKGTYPQSPLISSDVGHCWQSPTLPVMKSLHELIKLIQLTKLAANNSHISHEHTIPSYRFPSSRFKKEKKFH